MIIDTDKELVLLLSPKCGAKSLYSMFLELVPFSYANGSTIRYAFPGIPKPNPYHPQLAGCEKWSGLNLSRYRVFCFYREPLDWFLSVDAFMRRRNRDGDQFDWVKQVHYLDPPERFHGPFVELFDFRNFASEAVRVMHEFEFFHITEADIPHIADAGDNAARIPRNAIPQNKLDRFNEVYREDIEFFERRGITF